LDFLEVGSEFFQRSDIDFNKENLDKQDLEKKEEADK